MYRRDGQLILSATDLVGFLECGHLTVLDRAYVAGLKNKPDRGDDPALELLRRRGYEHEKRYIKLLEASGRTVTRLDGSYERPMEPRVAETEAAMRRGDDVIFQATVFHDGWVGHPDFLLRVPPATAATAAASAPPPTTTSPAQLSLFGGSAIHVIDSQVAGGTKYHAESQAGLGRDWHYEVADTKLAHSAKASALIQICSYVEQVERIQGIRPERVYVVTGGADLKEHPFRTAELMAYYRRAKARFQQELAKTLDLPASYPDPVEHCSVCKWFYVECRQQWRDDDALPLVAGISRKQRETLKDNSVATMTALSELPQPIRFEGMKRGQSDSMWNAREQARLQVKTAGREVPEYELLTPERDTDDNLVPDRGLAALPPPSADDLFFDIEGDPFAFWEGLEYLFGVWDGAEYRQIWAMDRAAEKVAFEEVIDLFHEHWLEHPDMHVYHYGVYEPSRLKSLAGRHATRADKLDELLRGRVFVDLYRVVRQGVRVGSERYSIKNMEPLYGFAREIELRDAGSSIVEFELLLEKGDPSGEIQDKIAAYNKDDTVSTENLREWLEARRRDAAATWGELPRPRKEKAPEEPKPPTDWGIRLAEVIGRLAATGDPRTELVASLLDFHRREEKASWWRFFELMTLSDDELFLENEPIGRLSGPELIELKDNGKKVYRYTFPAQEHKAGNRSKLHDPRLPPFAEGNLGIGVIDKDALTLTLAMPADWNGPHPTSIVPFDRIPIEGLQEGLARFGDWVAEHGLDAPGDEYRAARDLLTARSPRVDGVGVGEELYDAVTEGSSAAKGLARSLNATTLAIQGPPGSGKTYSGARMILDLVRDQTRQRVVGITGSSHKVITNLLREVWDAARAEGVPLEALQRIDSHDDEERPWATVKDPGKLDRMLASEEHDYRVIAGTVWLWAREKMADSVDTLFVDEAGQVTLANVVAASGAARNIVLLGDPQQLDQVLQGSHPEGAEQSALGHFLGAQETVSRDRGVFLEKTWRMHPEITSFTSELFYENKLESKDGLERQRVEGTDWLSGSGPRWVPVEHDGNTNASEEEARVVVEIIQALLGRSWLNKDGERRVLAADDIRVVSPFNAHRLLIDSLLVSAGVTGVPVGTVDKFQGQEAPVSIYTMATSRAEDAPRGLAFLYSLNRLNVATSRARALAIVVASPRLLDAVPRSPDQLRMVNGLAAFVESAAARVIG